MPSREGGVEVVVEELSTRMAAMGNDVTVYSRKGHNVAGPEYDTETVMDYKGVKVKEVSTLDIRGFAAATSSYFATKAAIKDRPDVIHFHAEGPCAMIGLAKRAGIKTVATIHGLDWQRSKWGKIGRIYIKLGEKIAAKKADEIIVLSESVADYFRSEYDRNTTFIPNAVSPGCPAPPKEINTKYKLDKDSYILYLGRIVPEKGIHYLIEAFSKIDTDKNLVIAGGSSDSASYFEEIKKMAAKDKRIILTGFVSGPVLDELYSNAAIYVLPSDLEGMPMSLLEAMSFQLCCVTSDIPECASVIQDAGFTFIKGDINSLCSVLSQLLEDSALRQSAGKKALDKVKVSFDWDSVVAKTMDIYKR